MIAVVNDTDSVIYYAESKDLLPSCLLEEDMWGSKTIYTHIAISERPTHFMPKYDKDTGVIYESYKPDVVVETRKEPLTVDYNVVRDSDLIKENAVLKDRLAEQERQMSLIRSHLGL